MALRTQLEAGAIDRPTIKRKLAELTRALLVRHPRDTELKHIAKGLAARDFVPAAPATLPRGTAAEVRHALLRRSDAELAALASALVVVPDVVEDPGGAIAALELFLRVPGEHGRATALLALLEGRGHDVSLARFELAVRDVSDDEGIAKALADVSADKLAEAQRRAAARALAKVSAYGSEWLAVVRDGTSIANHAAAFQRRPALRAELGAVATWFEAADPFLDAAHAADAAGDWARATKLYGDLDADDHATVMAARAKLFATGPHESASAPIASDLPQPKHALADRLRHMSRDVRDALDASALELIGDRRAAALVWLALSASGEAQALVHATRLAGELRAGERRQLLSLVRDRALDDETKLADVATQIRAELALQLDPDPWLPIRLFALHPRKPAAEVAVDAPLAESDPHHPDNRLAAASDLLAADKLEPASNILSALVRKADDPATPARLFAVVARALEADEPVIDLVHAVQRTLTDSRRGPLFAALLEAPTAAFALHEDLIAFALDPSRSDVDRLAALEVWLAIWRATETPPDPDAIRTLRETEPALLVAAALRLGRQPAPLDVLARFMAAPPSDPDMFSDALLALSLGR